MHLWSSCFFFVALSLGKTLVTGFHLKRVCATSHFFIVQKSNKMHIIFSFTVHWERCLVGCQSDPHYMRYSRLLRVWSCPAPCPCFQLLKPLGMGCLGNGGGVPDLHEFLFFSKCFPTKAVVSVSIHDLHCFTEGFRMCNSCALVVRTSLPPHTHSFCSNLGRFPIL